MWFQSRLSFNSGCIAWACLKEKFLYWSQHLELLWISLSLLFHRNLWTLHQMPTQPWYQSCRVSCSKVNVSLVLAVPKKRVTDVRNNYISCLCVAFCRCCWLLKQCICFRVQLLCYRSKSKDVPELPSDTCHCSRLDPPFVNCHYKHQDFKKVIFLSGHFSAIRNGHTYSKVSVPA